MTPPASPERPVDPGAPDPSDPGLQAERTALSWWRTSVGAMASALLLLHAALTGGEPAATILAFVAVGALAVVTVVCVLRSRNLRTHTQGPFGDGRIAMLLVSAAICVVAVSAVVVGLLEPPGERPW